MAKDHSYCTSTVLNLRYKRSNISLYLHNRSIQCYNITGFFSLLNKKIGFLTKLITIDQCYQEVLIATIHVAGKNNLSRKIVDL